MDLASVFLAARELEVGERVPSLKLALWAAAVSPNQPLDRNGAMTRVLARYVDRPLPVRETLLEELHTTGGMVYETMLTAIYRTEELDRLGWLAEFGTKPRTRAAWLEWRDCLYSLYHCNGKAYGMAYKTLSFAALLMWPRECELVPVDRFVMARFGYRTRTGNLKGTPQVRKQYLAVEQQVLDERAEFGAECIPASIWHWYKWEQWRQEQQVSRTPGKVESHAPLSCRVY